LKQRGNLAHLSGARHFRQERGIRMHNNPAVRKQLDTLSTFILNPANSAELLKTVSKMDQAQFASFLALLDKHHVLLRVLMRLEAAAVAAGPAGPAKRIHSAIARERKRIREALPYLKAICRELEAAGCPVVVIKTLEHWPDFGSDLDLFVTDDERCVFDILRSKFRARSTTRSWADFLSHKRSFQLPGLQTPVEVHIDRLGQAGELVQLAKRIVTRRRLMPFDGLAFAVPAPEERVIVTSLERMYRHLYFRISDLLNLARLVQGGELVFAELEVVAKQNGIWPGVAACLKIACDYTNYYTATHWALPPQVRSAASVEVEMLFERDGLWHFPVLPQGARLFAWELSHAIRRGDLAASARLSLLPPLASLASLAYAVTGNSGRIW
jgi:Uncharacterised nucleotidyltransferase